MSNGKRYVLDANVFIEAKNKYYGFDLCPGFWKSLAIGHKNKRVASIDKVFDELKARGDSLKTWARKAPDTFFKKTQDQAVVDAFRKMVNWVHSNAQFSQAAKAEFASVADGWLIAFAKVNGRVVVTHEEYASDVKKKVPMPNVCHEFDVDYINTFEMLDELKVQFILKTKR